MLRGGILFRTQKGGDERFKTTKIGSLRNKGFCGLLKKVKYAFNLELKEIFVHLTGMYICHIHKIYRPNLNKNVFKSVVLTICT